MKAEHQEALVALQSLYPVINAYLDVQRVLYPKWEGPDPGDWSLDLGSCGEQSLTVCWNRWDGCHCHGRQVPDQMEIPTEDLWKSLEVLRAEYAARLAERARQEEERKALGIQSPFERLQEDSERKKLATLLAKYPRE